MLSARNWANQGTNERIFDLRAAIIFIVSKSNAASEFGVSHNAAALFLDPPNASFANKINSDVRFSESLFLYSCLQLGQVCHGTANAVSAAGDMSLACLLFSLAYWMMHGRWAKSPRQEQSRTDYRRIFKLGVGSLFF
jgi:hypothetical protein